MHTFYHWVSKHKKLAFYMLALLLCGPLSFVMIDLEISLGVIIPVDAFLVFMAFAFVLSCQSTLINTAVEALHKCNDPYPLLQETQALLSYGHEDADAQMILINHCAALRHTGQYQQAYETLCSINIDKFAGIPSVNKIVYYNNLVDICSLLGRTEEAYIWYGKEKMLFDDLKNQKQRQQLELTIQAAYATVCYLQNDYAQALQVLNGIHQTRACMAIDDAMLYAKIALATGDIATARQKLGYVVVNGNRLYSVTEAQALLEQYKEV